MWAKIISWHIVKFDSRGGLHRTLCGRWAPKMLGPNENIYPDFPADEKTCESCLRIKASHGL